MYQVMYCHYFEKNLLSDTWHSLCDDYRSSLSVAHSTSRRIFNFYNYSKFNI